jgi:cytochrome c553
LPANAQQPPPQQLSLCMVCHGFAATSKMQPGAVIGRSAKAIENQLVLIREGLRDIRR